MLTEIRQFAGESIPFVLVGYINDFISATNWEEVMCLLEMKYNEKIYPSKRS